MTACMSMGPHAVRPARRRTVESLIVRVATERLPTPPSAPGDVTRCARHFKRVFRRRIYRRAGGCRPRLSCGSSRDPGRECRATVRRRCIRASSDAAKSARIVLVSGSSR